MMRLTTMSARMLLLSFLAAIAAVAEAQPVPGNVETQVAPVTWTTGTYQYDGSGNIKSIDGREFTYDAFGRLTRGKVDATNAQTYTYDDFGNMLTVTTNTATATRFGVERATNRMSQVNDASGTPYNGYAVYNADGTIRSTVSGDTFTYDGLGMVTESTIGVNRTIHLYSPSDERVGSVAIVNGAAAGRQWTIRSPSGAVLTRFTQTAAGAWSWDEDYVYGGARLLAARVSGPEKIRHFHTDHLGTPRVITGNGGVELSRHAYYPFGEELTLSTDAERAKFTGHERDDPSLDYMHARYYAVKWGRFLSVDPVINFDRVMTNPQGWNRYVYVSNNPINKFDPDGREENAAVGSGTIINRSSQTVYIAFDAHRIGPNGSNLDVVIPLRPGESSEKFTFDADAVVVAKGQNISGAKSGSFKVGEGTVEIKDGVKGKLVLVGNAAYQMSKKAPEAQRSGYKNERQTPQQWKIKDTPAQMEADRQKTAATVKERYWQKIKDFFF
jgi:RHS repeat-associated protein